MDIFDEHMPNPNQIKNKREEVQVSAQDLIAVPDGTITEEGLRENINVGILYIESWLRGVGAAAIYNKMEDAATAEISRTQIWQWINAQAKTDKGELISPNYIERLIPEEVEKIKDYVGREAFQKGRFIDAIALFRELVFGDEYEEFLTLPAYKLI